MFDLLLLEKRELKKSDIGSPIFSLKNLPNENFVYNAMAQNLRVALDYSIKDLTFIVFDGEKEVLQRKYSVNSLLVPQQKQENAEEAKDFLTYLFSAENQKKYAESLGSPSAFQDVDANWAPQAVIDGVNSAIASATNIGYTNEKPAGFSGDDAGRLVQELLAGVYTPEEFAKAYEDAWNAGY